jgi:hypothetical protein
MLSLCTLLAGYAITGAVETSPNRMEISFLDPTGEMAWMYIPTSDYLECLPLLTVPDQAPGGGS